MHKEITIQFHGRPLSIEVGKVAKQANGSAILKYGESTVLITAVAAQTDREGVDFLPLSVDYFERFAAAGKIPGGFFKREGRQTEREILVCRLCDRPIRPLFPDGYRRETQVNATVLSNDPDCDTDVLAVMGSSLALHVSDIPFHGPIAAVRVGRVDGTLICNPTKEQSEKSDMDIVVAASKEAIVMVEGGAQEVPEADVLDALMFGFDSVQPLLAIQDEMREAVGKEKFSVEVPVNGENNQFASMVQEKALEKVKAALANVEKIPRYAAIRKAKEEILAQLIEEDAANEEKTGLIKEAVSDLIKKETRRMIVDEQKRLDARGTKDIRNISTEVGLLPRAHGSALFTRGETQALVTATLGTGDDEQRIDSLEGEWRKKFMLHYNFPAFSVGEVRPNRGPGRREIGHGTLAHRAIEKVLPGDEFPYTIRVVSDILESNGSSSMATVCGGSMSLMDAGVPLKAPVAGIAMGLIKHDDDFVVLSDILGDEDHIGDMDFKVAGSENGVTAIQMDIKVRGISREILNQALEQAREGRLHILGCMKQGLESPREELSKYAPRIETIQIPTDKIRDIIGPGGKMIRAIMEESGAKLDVEDSGIVTIASNDAEALRIAREKVEGITAVPEVGKVYKGKAVRVVDFGAFVQILPNTDGLLHVSEMDSEERVYDANDFIKEGEDVEVKVLEIDRAGKVRLTQYIEGENPHRQERKPRNDRNSRDRNSRDRGRGGRDGGRGGRDRRPPRR